MGRPVRDGLLYFPLELGFFADPKIQRMTARFGADAPAYYLYLLCRAYGGSGYYVACDGAWREDAARALRCSPGKIRTMTGAMVAAGLLTQVELDGKSFLTSHGIQRQYQECCKSKGKYRKIEVEEALWLLKKNETEGYVFLRSFFKNSGREAPEPEKKTEKTDAGAASFSGERVFSEKTPVFSEKTTVNAEEKKNINISPSAAAAGGERKTPSLSDFRAAAREMGIPEREAESCYYHYLDRGWTDKRGRDVRGFWRSALDKWHRRELSAPGGPPRSGGRVHRAPAAAPVADAEDFARTDEEKLKAMRKMYAHMKREGGNGHAEN